MILVDTSVLIDFLKGQTNDKIQLFSEILSRNIDFGFSANLKYYGVNKNNNFLVQNITPEPSSLSDSGKTPALPAEYSYCWYFDGEKLRVIDHGKPIDIQRRDSHH